MLSVAFSSSGAASILCLGGAILAIHLASSLQKMRGATAAQNPTPVPANAPIRRSGSSSSVASVIQITLAKLADTIVVREEADIDKIGERVAKEVVLAVKNMVPVPA